jgi:molybdopterin molybdotransferase
LISADEALRIILGAVRPGGAEEIPLARCAGRVLARDLSARIDNPLFDYSSMDGYAVRARDMARASSRRPARLKLVGRIEAGDHARLRLSPGQAIRILTGAPLPLGADAVVMQEDVRQGDGSVDIEISVKAAENVRFAGTDIRKGRPLLPGGQTLGSREVALLAGQGFIKVPVTRRPKASVVVTGSELVAPGASLSFGQIHNGNGPGLAAALAAAGAEVRDRGIARDNPAELRRVFRRALAGADLLLVSGGVSVGDKDLTRAILEELGMKTRFWKVRVKPGKPLLFGTRGATAVFGLPGNPLSAWVCCEEFVRPAVDRMLGRRAGSRQLKGRVERDFPADGKRRQYAFAQARPQGGGYLLRLLSPQDSGMIHMACRADALALVPEGVLRVRAGDLLDFRFLS